MARGRSGLRATSGIGKILLLGVISFALPLCATLIAARLVASKQHEGVQAEFAALALESEKALLHRLNSYQQAMLGAAGLFNSSEEVSRDEWRHYVQALDIGTNLPGVNGIGYVEEVDPERMTDYLTRMRKGGAPDFSIHPHTQGLPYFIITYVQPLDTNVRVTGLNLAFEENRRRAAMLARDSGQPAITRRVLLVNDRTGSSGFLMLHPMYQTGMPQETPEQRRAAFRGWIYAPFVGANLLRNLTESQGRMLIVRVYDGEEASPEMLIYGSPPESEDRAAPAFSVRKQVKVMQRTWTLDWTSTARFEKAQASNTPLMVLLAGIVFSAGVAAFVLFFARRAQTVERLVAQKTREIAASEERLKLLIGNTPAAVAMFDRDMRYIMTSERWLEDYGLAGQDVIGRSHYEVFPEIGQNDAWREHHRRAIAGEILSKEEDSWQRGDGRTEWVKWDIHPWIAPDGRIGGVVMFTEVITARKKTEQRSEFTREIAVETAEAASVQDILKLSLVKVCAFLRWPMAHAYFWSHEKPFTDPMEIWHHDPSAPGGGEDCYTREIVAFALESRLHGRVIAERKPVFVERQEMPAAGGDGANCPRFGVGVPIFVRQRVAAVLEFYTPDPVADDTILLSFVEVIGLQLSRAIERREAEDALKESEERYERAVEGSNVALWEWNIATGELYWSPRFMQMAGVEPQYFTPRQEQFYNSVHPSDRDRFFAAVQAHLREKLPFDIEYRLKRPDGVVVWVHSRGQASWDSFGNALRMAGSADDISERLAQQEALREREMRLRDIIEKAVDGLIVADHDGNIEIFNPACERMFGYRADEVIGKSMRLLMPDAYYERHASAIRRHKENPHSKVAPVVRELEGKRKDGTTFPIDLSISDMSLPGRRIFSGIIRDVSERKETERRMLAYAAELERSNRELDEFAYVASHDLKAPLRVIGNAARWLEEDLAEHLREEDRANMELLRSRVRRMEKLLDDLLEYSRVGRSSDSRFAETVGGGPLIDDILLLLSPPPGFTVKVAPGFKDILVNRMPLQQVLYNLIANAIKHHDKQSGVIEVDLDTQGDGDMYRFTVRDDGPGIPERFHEQVFKMFQTLKPRDQIEGSGMGLAFVKKTVGYFGGDLELVSEEGQGSAFSFTWPKEQKAVGEVQWKAA